MKILSRRLSEGKKALVFAFIFGLTCFSCTSRESAVLNKPVLIINGHEISTQEFSERLAIKLRDFDALHAKDASLEGAKEDLVQTFVLETLTRDYAKKEKITVADADIDARAKDIKDHYPDDFAFRRALSDQNLSISKWRDDLAYSLLQKKVFQAITAKTGEPSESEMKQEFEENKALFQQPARIRLRQIVLEKEDDAKRIMDELEKGADLGKLAKQFSIAPEASNNGDTGWLDKGTLDIFDLGFKMNPGARSKILKSPYGYHIFEVIKKEPESHLNFQDAKAKLRARLIEKRSQAIFTAWLEEQVRKSSVKRNDAILRATKVTTRGS